MEVDDRVIYKLTGKHGTVKFIFKSSIGVKFIDVLFDDDTKTFSRMESEFELEPDMHCSLGYDMRESGK